MRNNGDAYQADRVFSRRKLMSGVIAVAASPVIFPYVSAMPMASSGATTRPSAKAVGRAILLRRGRFTFRVFLQPLAGWAAEQAPNALCLASRVIQNENPPIVDAGTTTILTADQVVGVIDALTLSGFLDAADDFEHPERIPPADGSRLRIIVVVRGPDHELFYSSDYRDKQGAMQVLKDIHAKLQFQQAAAYEKWLETLAPRGVAKSDGAKVKGNPE